jgi:hypothetical protein
LKLPERNVWVSVAVKVSQELKDMKKTYLSLAFGASFIFATQAATLTVTTTNNVDPAASQLSLAQAISRAQDGDTIAFNIPGPGPHYIERTTFTSTATPNPVRKKIQIPFLRLIMRRSISSLIPATAVTLQ